MALSRSKGLLALMGLIVLGLFLFIFIALYSIRAAKLDGTSSDDTIEMKGSSSIAVVDVTDVIFDARKTIKLLLRAEKDKSVKAIILRIDSPGGAVGPCQEMVEEIRRIDTSVKPVYASMGTVAASGGYYIASAARRIYANPGTLTGSIGVIMEFVDMSKLLDWAKVSPQIIKGGKFKDVGNPSRGMTEEERLLLKGMIDRVHVQFKRDILKTRGTKLKASIEDLAQGQIFSGEEAMQVGLVDEMAGLWEAGRRIHAELKLKEEYSLRFLKLKKEFSFGDFMGNVDESLANVKQGVLMNKVPLLLAPFH